MSCFPVSCANPYSLMVWILFNVFFTFNKDSFGVFVGVFGDDLFINFLAPRRPFHTDFFGGGGDQRTMRKKKVKKRLYKVYRNQANKKGKRTCKTQREVNKNGGGSMKSLTHHVLLQQTTGNRRVKNSR